MKKLISSIAAIAAAAVIAMGSGYVNAKPAKSRTFAAGENPQPFCPPFCGGDQSPDGR